MVLKGVRYDLCIIYKLNIAAILITNTHMVSTIYEFQTRYQVIINGIPKLLD